MLSVSSVTSLVQAVAVVGGAVVIAVNSVRNNQSSLSNNTIMLLRQNNDAKDAEIASMKAQHDKEIALMQNDIKALTQRVESLQQANMVLQNTVTGKETLTAIVEIMKPLPTLFGPGGTIEEFRQNQQKCLKDLSEIRKALEENPAVPTPPHEPFRHRKPKSRQPSLKMPNLAPLAA